MTGTTAKHQDCRPAASCSAPSPAVVHVVAGGAAIIIVITIVTIAAAFVEFTDFTKFTALTDFTQVHNRSAGSNTRATPNNRYVKQDNHQFMPNIRAALENCLGSPQRQRYYPNYFHPSSKLAT